MRIRENYLQCDKVSYLPCTKNSRLLETIDTVVLHGTGGSSAISSARYMARPDTAVSAHLVIDRMGGVIQLLPFHVRAWHAGKSSHAGRTGLNDFSIGIELDNAGKLVRRGDRFFSWFGKEYQPDEVFTTEEGGHAAYYHAYTTLQVEQVVRVCMLLKSAYPLRWLVRHSDITGRKVDPGPAFPFEQVKKDVGF